MSWIQKTSLDTGLVKFGPDLELDPGLLGFAEDVWHQIYENKKKAYKMI